VTDPSDRLRPVPTTIVTGFLGVGKTTAILDAFRHRPDGERWAVLVNEFGQVGIDGAVLEAQGGYVVREIPGGCICCSAGVQLQVHLAKLLAEERPDRLFVEPTGLAAPSSIVDLVRRPWFRASVDLRAVITLVDPRRWMQGPLAHDDAYLAQLEVADVLVANKADLADAEQLAAFRAGAGKLWPPKLVIATTDHGRLAPAWLDLAPSPERMARVPVDPHLAPDEAGSEVDERGHADEGHDHEHAHVTEHVRTAGWVFPPDEVFDWERLRSTLQDLSVPNEALPDGVLRLKGVFRTNAAWVLAQGDGERLQFTPFQHRRDSRVELIARAEPPPDWAKVEAALRGALLAAPPGS
jgi:G3E family GTPase